MNTEDGGQISYNSLVSQFNSEQTTQFMAVIDGCHNLKTENEFLQVVRGPLRSLVPHEYAACGIGERGKLTIDHLINIDFPEEYLASVTSRTQSNFILNSPVAEKWAIDPRTTFVSEVNNVSTDNQKWMSAVQQHHVKNMMVSGLHDLGGSKTSYFCFAKCPFDDGEWYEYVVDLLTPHLHTSLTRICSQTTETNDCMLTDREKEVLQLVGVGLTNTQIGKKLFISENTVKNHVQSIFKKLNVVNRVQAVSRAYNMRIIQEITSS